MKKFTVVLLTAIIAFSFAVNCLAASTYGDLNDDGAVNSSDALLVLNYTTSLTEFSNSQRVFADVNIDGEVNSSDSLLILQRAVGLNNIFPAEMGEEPDLDHDIFG